MALGRIRGGLEGGKGVEGGRHGQFWPKCGEFSTDIGDETMVRCRGIHATEQHAIRASFGSVSKSGSKGIIVDPDGGPESASGRLI